MSKDKIIIIDGVRYHGDRPSNCRACYFWKNRKERFDPMKLPPIRRWETERDKLKAERQQLSRRYSTLKDEVKEVEQIRRNVHSILKEETRKEQPKKTHDLDR